MAGKNNPSKNNKNVRVRDIDKLEGSGKIVSEDTSDPEAPRLFLVQYVDGTTATIAENFLEEI